MARSAAIQGRVAEAILDVAANLLARGGEPPSMADIAAAAGVGRATLYRHFPTREQLLQALSTTARDATAARLAEADLDAVPVTEAIARVARVVAAGGSKYAALISRFGALDSAGDAEQQIDTMLRALLQRGLKDGTFRGDLTVTELLFLLGQLLQAAARMTAEHVAGVEKAAALVTSVFLHGTERRPDTDRRRPGHRRRRRHSPQSQHELIRPAPQTGPSEPECARRRRAAHHRPQVPRLALAAQRQRPGGTAAMARAAMFHRAVRCGPMLHRAG